MFIGVHGTRDDRILVPIDGDLPHLMSSGKNRQLALIFALPCRYRVPQWLLEAFARYVSDQLPRPFDLTTRVMASLKELQNYLLASRSLWCRFRDLVLEWRHLHYCSNAFQMLSSSQDSRQLQNHSEFQFPISASQLNFRPLIYFVRSDSFLNAICSKFRWVHEFSGGLVLRISCLYLSCCLIRDRTTFSFFLETRL